MDKKGKFVTGEVKSFKASKKKKAVDVIIPPGLAKKFDVESKPMPDDLPENWDGYQLTWINNIGLKKKSDTRDTPDDFYEIQIKKDAVKGKKDIVVVYWDGSNVVGVSKADYGDLDGDTISVRLNLEDPPIGLGGR